MIDKKRMRARQFGMSLMFMSLQMLLAPFYPYNSANSGILWWVSLIIWFVGVIVLVTFHELAHFLTAKFYKAKPKFAWYKHPVFWWCPAIKHRVVTARQGRMIGIAPQIITVGLFAVSVASLSALGYFWFVLGFASLLSSVSDFDSILVSLKDKNEHL